MGNYHHHQNPSAFKLDKNVISTICNLYDADGLYAINANSHSPLIGFAYDGFPIYGAYGYANVDGTGGIARVESSYKLRNITVRTQYSNGSNVTAGPAVNVRYPIGHYREDYEYNSANGDLDEHNGRFSVTPEYPDGIYAYFATVDANWNSAYPYVVGPTFYGNVTASKVNAVRETTDVYIMEVTDNTDTTASININSVIPSFNVFPNPAQNFIAIQAGGLVKSNINIDLIDMEGSIVRSSQIKQGSTIWYIDTQTLYNGTYVLRINSGKDLTTHKVVIQN